MYITEIQLYTHLLKHVFHALFVIPVPCPVDPGELPVASLEHSSKTIAFFVVVVTIGVIVAVVVTSTSLRFRQS